MKKIIEWSALLKTLAAMLFAGFICLYIVGGILYAWFIDESFPYTISFVHLLKSIGYATVISLLWGLCFGGIVIRKWSFWKRQLLFKLSLAALFTSSVFLLRAVESEWKILWLTVAGVITLFAIVLSYVSEWYFRKTSKEYTEVLKVYQLKNLNQ